MPSERTEILMFHRVLPDEPRAFGLPGCYRIRGTALTSSELRSAVEACGCVIPLREVEEALEQGRKPPPGCVLSFDDGYREHAAEVADLLDSLGISATFYVCAEVHAGASAPLVVDAWYWLLDNTRRARFALTTPGGERLEGCLDSLEGKRAWVVGPPKRALLSLPLRQQRALVAALAEAMDTPLPVDLASELYMSTGEWQDLARRGHRIGAHGVLHQHLTALDDDELEPELERSLRAVPGDAPFAYPDGAHEYGIIGVEDLGPTPPLPPRGSGRYACTSWHY